MRSASAAGGNANADREYKRKRQIIVNDDVVNRVPGCQGARVVVTERCLDGYRQTRDWITLGLGTVWQDVVPRTARGCCR